MPEHTNPPGSDSDADFIGWQQNMSGGYFPLFNITVEAHPFYLSTVGDETLRRLHLRVPLVIAPYPEVGISPLQNLETELSRKGI